MENNKNFDQFFQKVLKEDPSVPPSFAWDQMDIETPKRKSTKLWAYMAILLIIFSISFYLLYSVSKHGEEMAITKPQTKQPTKSEQTHDNDQSLLDEQLKVTSTEKTTQTGQSNQSTDNTQKSGQNHMSLDHEAVHINKPVIHQHKQLVDSPSPEAHKKNHITNHETSINKATTSISENTSYDNNHVDARIIPQATSDKSTKLNSYQVVSYHKIPRLKPFVVIQKPDYDYAKKMIANGIEQNKNNQQKSRKQHLNIYAYAGSNNFLLKVDDAAELNGKLNSELGLSVSVGLEKPFANNFVWYGDINYHELHTLFSHTRELSRTYNLTQDLVKIKYQHIWHNNYNNQFVISTGIGKSWHFQDFSIQLSAGLSTGKRINNTGKTLQNDAVTRLENLALPNSWIIQLSPAVSANYMLTNNIAASFRYTLRHSINKSVLINTGGSANLIQHAELGLKYHF